MEILNLEIVLKLLNSENILCNISHQYNLNNFNNLSKTIIDLPLGLFAKNHKTLIHQYNDKKITHSTVIHQDNSENKYFFYKYDNQNRIIEVCVKDMQNVIQEVYTLQYFDEFIIIAHFPHENQLEGFFKLKYYIDSVNRISKRELIYSEQGNFEESKFFFYADSKLVKMEEYLKEIKNSSYELCYDQKNRLLKYEYIGEDFTRKEINIFEDDTYISKRYTDNFLTNIMEFEVNNHLIKDSCFFYKNDKLSYSKTKDYTNNTLSLFAENKENRVLLAYKKTIENKHLIYDANSTLICTITEIYDENKYDYLRKWYDSQNKELLEKDVKPKWILQLIYPFEDEINYTEQAFL